jgi:phytoene dehydrogenase-like protein
VRALVVGADTSGLVAARELARGGVEVTLVGTRTTPTLTLPLRGRDPAIPAGDNSAGTSGWGWSQTVLSDGSRLELTDDVAQTAAAIHRLSPRDADEWPRFCERMHVLAGVLEDLYRAPPPDPLTHEARGFIELARSALRLRKLGRKGMDDFLRLAPMSVADLMNDTFESAALKAVLGAQGVMHLAQGPRSGGTAFNLLHHHVGCPSGVFRRMRTNRCDVQDGVTGIQRLEAQVARIDVRDGGVAGVAFDNGETVACDLVVSAEHPRRVLLELVDPAVLDPELQRAIRNIRSRGVVANVRLELDRAPDFTNLVVARSLDHLERAYDDSKYGRLSSDPYVEASYVGSSHDGVHRVDVHVQYVPYALREGAWDDAAKAELVKRAISKIEEAAPGICNAIVALSVLTPVDLEARYGYPQGQAHHAEIALDQILWMRPVAELAQYRTPIRGLYLCGPAMHPGIPALAGANAASVILGDLRKKKI